MEKDSTPAINNPICPTEEYAIKDFMSGCRKQMNLVIIAPIREILRNGVEYVLLNIEIIFVIRINPYPPSFKRTAARIIDPEIGAST